MKVYIVSYLGDIRYAGTSLAEAKKVAKTSIDIWQGRKFVGWYTKVDGSWKLN